MNTMYRYQGCALQNVYLENGYEIVSSPYGEGVTIHDLEGLHAALGRAVVFNPAPLTGSEFRFLRQELELSQDLLGSLLGRDDQTVRRWENSKNKRVDPIADRFVRVLYVQSKLGAKKLAPALDILQKLEATAPSAKGIFARDEGDVWKAMPLAALA